MPRQTPIHSEDDAYEEAIRLLARAPRSAAEVAARLEAKGADPDAIESVLGRLRAHRHVDDAELASDQAFKLLDGKGQAPALAVQTLIARGIAERVAREAVEAAREERSEQALCEAALRRRNNKAIAPSAAAREGRALARLGYDAEIIARVLERAFGGEEIP